MGICMSVMIERDGMETWKYILSNLAKKYLDFSVHMMETIFLWYDYFYWTHGKILDKKSACEQY